jgi:hypothetical protein
MLVEEVPKLVKEILQGKTIKDLLKLVCQTDKIVKSSLELEDQSVTLRMPHLPTKRERTQAYHQSLLILPIFRLRSIVLRQLEKAQVITDNR